jgi:hypothetical protein
MPAYRRGEHNNRISFRLVFILDKIHTIGEELTKATVQTIHKQYSLQTHTRYADPIDSSEI